MRKILCYLGFKCWFGLHKWDYYNGHRHQRRVCLWCGRRETEFMPGRFK